MVVAWIKYITLALAPQLFSDYYMRLIDYRFVLTCTDKITHNHLELRKCDDNNTDIVTSVMCYSIDCRCDNDIIKPCNFCHVSSG